MWYRYFVVFAYFLCLCLGLAKAQATLPTTAKNTVFKCQLEGRIEYSDTPCPDAVTVDVTPTRGVDHMSGTQRRSASVQREISYENLTGQSQRSLAIGWGDALPKPNNAATAAPVPVAPPKAGNSPQRGAPLGNTVVAALGVLQPLLWLLPLFVVAAALKTVAFKGWIGERLVRHLLKKRLHAPSEVSLHNVTVQDERGSTQIDSILISEYGIFVLEVKNYSGWITGRVADSHWRQTHYRRQYEFQNPLRQNYRHTQALERLLGLPSPVFHSVIVFAGDCELKSDFPDNVCTKADLNAYIDSFTQKVFPKQQVQAIAQAIEKHRLPPTWATHRAHVQHLRKQRQKTEPF